MLLDSVPPKCLSSRTISKKPIDSTDFNNVFVGCGYRLLSLAWTCQIAAHKDHQHRGVPEVEVSTVTQEMGKIGSRRAVVAKSSERLAVDRTMTEKAKTTVHIVSKPNLAAGPVTKYRDMIAPNEEKARHENTERAHGFGDPCFREVA